VHVDILKSLTSVTVAALASLILLGCKERSSPSPSSPTPPVSPAPVDSKRLDSAEQDASNWLTHGRTYGEQRYSPLKSIDSVTVKDLRLAWYVDLPAGERGQASTPLVVDGVMYVTTSWSRALALDASTGKLLWSFDPKVPGDWAVNACCDVVNRGVAFWQGKVYLGTLDGRLLALDAADGKLLWQSTVIDRAERATITGAPRVINGRVYIGSAGGEFGVRGRLTAVDAASGTILWRFFTVPGNPGVTPENLHLPAAAKTWTGEWWRYGGGGTVWDAISYDPKLDLLYVGTGNAAPWSRQMRSPKGGDNLYTSSIVAMHAATGEYVWHYQTTPGDEWGYDAASQILLADITIDGRRRAVLMQASANGFFYVLDRTTGELISAAPFVPTTWASAIDLATGRPKENPSARYSATRKPFDARPGQFGAHSWQPLSYNPATGLVYIPVMENATRLTVAARVTESRFAERTGVEATDVEGFTPSSRLTAWDPVHQTEVWRATFEFPVLGGTLATAGNLVFVGTPKGAIGAYDASTGENLWSALTQAPVVGAPIAYSDGGKQYIALVVGSGGAQALRGGAPMAKSLPPSNVPRVLVYALSGRASLPPVAAVGSNLAGVDFFLPVEGSGERGESLYARFCSRCHGQVAIGTGPLPDLRRTPVLGQAQEWQRIVHSGLLASRGMPGYFPELSSSQVEEIRSYVSARSTAAQ
jgi:quinohemoprotein ethanol dehydrogenase